MGLKKKCKKAVKEQIAKQYRYEANVILNLTTKSICKEFLNYHKKNQGNICCLILDKAKQNLVDEGIMVQRNNDGFGNYPF